MFNKCVNPKRTSGYDSDEQKLHFPLKNADLKKQWIHFVNRRDWLARKHSMLCELHFGEKYFRRGEKYYSGR